MEVLERESDGLDVLARSKAAQRKIRTRAESQGFVGVRGEVDPVVRPMTKVAHVGRDHPGPVVPANVERFLERAAATRSGGFFVHRPSPR
jgi:hypothetical protein